MFEIELLFIFSSPTLYIDKSCVFTEFQLKNLETDYLTKIKGFDVQTRYLVFSDSLFN